MASELFMKPYLLVLISQWRAGKRLSATLAKCKYKSFWASTDLKLIECTMQVTPSVASAVGFLVSNPEYLVIEQGCRVISVFKRKQHESYLWRVTPTVLSAVVN